MVTFDLLMIAFVLYGAYKGWKYGFFSSAISLIGTLLILIVSFYLKNPLSTLLYQNCPFISFKGIFTGITSLNILLYESIAYIICVVLLTTILKVILKLTGIIDKLIRLTLVFAIPSRILGLLLGGLKNYIYVFFITFVCTIIPFTSTFLKDSKISDKIIDKTPLLSEITSNLYGTFNEIYDICIKNEDASDENKKVGDYEALEVLLKNKIIAPESVQKLVEKKKLDIENVDTLIEKYKEKKE